MSSSTPSPSFTQSLFQQTSKKYFPYSSFHTLSGTPSQVAESLSHLPYKEAQEIIKSQCDYTFEPRTYRTAYDNSAFLVRGGQFLYRADYRSTVNNTMQKLVLNHFQRLNRKANKDGSLSPKEQKMYEKLTEWQRRDFLVGGPLGLGGHMTLPDCPDTIYNKASSRHLFGLFRVTRDEFAKLAYYVPADYLKFCSENHEALNACFDKHLTTEHEEDMEIPQQCQSLYQDVNISCGLRRMQVVNRIMSDFDSQSQMASFNIAHHY